MPLEHPIDQQAAGGLVLVTQQRVDEGVARSLAVGQTFGEHAPARTDGLRPEQLHNSASKREGEGEGKKVTRHPENEPILRSA